MEERTTKPALSSFLKVLGERYPLPTIGGRPVRRDLANARSVAMNRASIGAMSLAGSRASRAVSRASAWA